MSDTNTKKQGIRVVGTLMNLKHIEAKEYNNNVVPAHQTLQIVVLNEDGLSQIDVKDKENKFKQSEVGKIIDIGVVYTVINDKAYFRLVS